MFSTPLRVLALLALPLLTPASVVSAASPTVSATLEQCVTAAGQAGRSATFAGQMETVPGTHRMAMRVVVEERAPGEAAFHALGAPGLDVWQHSEAGVKIYKDVRQVTDLPAPGAFRAVVHFRWLSEDGSVIARAVRRTSQCRQPAPGGMPPGGAQGSAQAAGESPAGAPGRVY